MESIQINLNNIFKKKITINNYESEITDNKIKNNK